MIHILKLIRNRKWVMRLYWIYWVLGSIGIFWCIGSDIMPMIPGIEIPIPVILYFPFIFLPFIVDYIWQKRGLKKGKRPREKFDLSKARHMKFTFIVWIAITLGILIYGSVNSPRQRGIIILEPEFKILSLTSFFGGFILICVTWLLIMRTKVKKALNAGSGRSWVYEFKTSLIEEQYVGDRAKILNERLKQKSDWKLDRTRRKKLLKLGLYLELPNELKQPLEQRILVFLESFKFTSVDIGEITEDMQLLIAAQACLLIVNRPMCDYRQLREIKLWKNRIKDRPGFRGTANQREVNLVWKYIKSEVEIEFDKYKKGRHRSTGSRDGRNLTLHEFAHVLDFVDDGVAQNIPVAKNSKDYKEWKAMLDEAYPKLEKAYKQYRESALRLGSKPEIRDYAFKIYPGGRQSEFFTCATEAFFERGYHLSREWPKVYNLLKDFYRIDPASWQ